MSGMLRFQVFIAIVGMALSAFISLNQITPRKESSEVIDVWYEYVGPDNASGRANPENYLRYDPQPVNYRAMCAGTDELCAVRLPDFGIHPLAIPTIEIEFAIAIQIETNIIELKSYEDD